MGWLGAIGGALVNHVEDKLAKKYLGGGNPNPQDPNQSQPDPTQPPPTSIPGYSKYRAMQNPLGRAIAGGIQRYRTPQEDPSNQMDRSPVPDAAPTQPLPQPVMQGDTNLSGVEPMAQGKMVTRPTVALLAEHGQPEMVVPMNANPMNKVSMAPPAHGVRLPPIPMPRLRYRK